MLVAVGVRVVGERGNIYERYCYKKVLVQETT